MNEKPHALFPPAGWWKKRRRWRLTIFSRIRDADDAARVSPHWRERSVHD